MLDLLICGATVVDGTGAPAAAADVGVKDGRIVELGRITGAAAERIDAAGAWLTPGFVDIHTHYDGQASWDPTFSPSIHHGVTTLMMGNCGVGFAPLRKGRQADLIDLMEGVEDIPGVALAEGVRFDWESFVQYMDALARLPHSLDFLVQVPHDPVRMAVMGERALAGAAATAQDVAAMRALVREALQAGAAGFSTGRSDNHRTASGKDTPACEADAAELTGIVAAFDGLQHGVVQVVSDFDLLQGEERFDGEFDLIEVENAAGRQGPGVDDEGFLSQGVGAVVLAGAAGAGDDDGLTGGAATAGGGKNEGAHGDLRGGGDAGGVGVDAVAEDLLPGGVIGDA